MGSIRKDQENPVKKFLQRLWNEFLELIGIRKQEVEERIQLGSEERIRVPSVWKWRARGLPVEIYFNKEVYKGIVYHARANSEIEVGGVLIGNVSQDDEGVYYVDVTDYIEAQDTKGEVARMTFTHRAWAEIYERCAEIEKDFPDKMIVGWYHTHPRHGVFLSGDDLYIHRTLFPNPYQIALVVDSKNDMGGFFIWMNGDIQSEVPSEFKFRLSNPSLPLIVPEIKTPQEVIRVTKKDLLMERVPQELPSTSPQQEKYKKVPLMEAIEEKFGVPGIIPILIFVLYILLVGLMSLSILSGQKYILDAIKSNLLMFIGLTGFLILCLIWLSVGIIQAIISTQSIVYYEEESINIKVPLKERRWFKYLMMGIICALGVGLIIYIRSALIKDGIISNQIPVVVVVLIIILVFLGVLIYSLWRGYRLVISKLSKLISYISSPKRRSKVIAGIVILVVGGSIAFFAIQEQRKSRLENERMNVIKYIGAVKEHLNTADEKLKELKGWKGKYQSDEICCDLESKLDKASTKIEEADNLRKDEKISLAKKEAKEAQGLVKEVEKKAKEKIEEIKAQETFSRTVQECKSLLHKAKEQNLWSYDEGEFESLKRQVKNASFSLTSVEDMQNIKENINTQMTKAQEQKEEITEIRLDMAKLYNQGVQYYNKDEYEKAIKKFEEVKKLDHNYEGVQWYLKKARSKLMAEKKKRQATQKTDPEIKEDKKPLKEE